MGSVQSSVTPEALIAGVVVAGSAATYGWSRYAHKEGEHSDQKPSDAPQQAPAASSSKKGGAKKKGNAEDAEFDRILAAAAKENLRQAATAAKAVGAQPRVVAFPDIVPGAFEPERLGGASAPDSETGASQKKGKKKKGGKKDSASAAGGAGAGVGAQPLVPPITSPESSIVHISADTPAEPARPTPASKKDKKKRKAAAGEQAQKQAAGAGSSSSGSAPVPSARAGSAAAAGPSAAGGAQEDASWTRVESRKRPVSTKQASKTGMEPELLTSDTNLGTSTTSVTDGNTDGSVGETEDKTEDESGSAQMPSPLPQENRRTFAEKMLPKPRRTGVEDMEDEPLAPPLARVLRVKPGPDERPAKGFSWGDYEEYARPGDGSGSAADDGGTSADGDEDDTWEEVPSRRRPVRSGSAAGATSSASMSASASSAAETLTKRQRQNAARREAAKVDKQALDVERAARLAKHQRELERAKIAEQFASHGSKKKPSGGMNASVEGGKLVWE